jgi:hypothetical protein
MLKMMTDLLAHHVLLTRLRVVFCGIILNEGKKKSKEEIHESVHVWSSGNDRQIPFAFYVLVSSNVVLSPANLPNHDDDGSSSSPTL